ncbi:hypothetical protein BJX76DRAFT_137738 [Aspergillus varians]
MAEEKKSRSKRPSSKSKRTKDVPTDSDADYNMKQVDKEKVEEKKENTVEKDESGGEKKQRRSMKRRLGEDEQEGGLSTSVNGEKEERKEERKSKKKKVSFAAESKAKSLSPSPVEGDEDAEADDENANASKKDKKKKKKEKSKKKTEASTDNDSESAVPKNGEPPVLSYLDQYYNNRSAWKFQKIREIQIFKHILSLEHIPAIYEAALLAYLQGLKGEAAKQRLREVAQAAVKADVEEMKETNVEISEKPSDDLALSPTVNYRKAVYAFRTKLTEGELTEDLGESFEQLDAAMLEKFRKRRRAEAVLFAIDGRTFTMSNLKAPPQKGKNAQNQPANKKKKNRTAFVDISSSSESDSEDGKNTTQPQPASQPAKKKKKKSRTAVVDISSSSESESSSSDSSSDSDSDSSSSSSSSSSS